MGDRATDGRHDHGGVSTIGHVEHDGGTQSDDGRSADRYGLADVSLLMNLSRDLTVSGKVRHYGTDNSSGFLRL